MIWVINAIENGSGKDISGIANAPSALEILFLPEAKFKITGVENDNKTIYMQELLIGHEAEFRLFGTYHMTQEDYDALDHNLGMFD